MFCPGKSFFFENKSTLLLFENNLTGLKRYIMGYTFIYRGCFFNRRLDTWKFCIKSLCLICYFFLEPIYRELLFKEFNIICLFCEIFLLCHGNLFSTIKSKDFKHANQLLFLWHAIKFYRLGIIFGLPSRISWINKWGEFEILRDSCESKKISNI